MTGNQLKYLIKKWCIAGLAVALGMCTTVYCLRSGAQAKDGQRRWSRYVEAFFEKQMEDTFFLLFRYVEEEKNGNTLAEKIEHMLLKQMPIYEYSLAKGNEWQETEDELVAELIRQQEGDDEDRKNIDEEQLDYQEGALHIENSMLEEMERENSLHNTNNEVDIVDETEEITEQPEKEFIIPEYPAYAYDWSENWDYAALVSNFYAVDNSTSLQEDYLDLDQLLYQDLSIDRTGEEPQILIYHTHAHEGFEDSIEGDDSTTILGAGERLATLLEEKYGFKVLHHKGIYDEERADAYAQSLPAIEKLLEENPSIEVVIDLHRDEMTGGRKLVMDLQGKPTARFMFFNGLSYTKKGGEISYLENPYIQDNLAFSFQAQVAANEYYPGIARKVYLKAYRYNMHLKPKSMLIELGAQNNTVEEIMNACDPLAHILAIVLGDVVYLKSM